MNTNLIDLIKGSSVLKEKGFVFDSQRKRSERVVGEVRQSLYYVKGRIGFRDIAAAVSFLDYEIATDLHLEQIQERIAYLDPHLNYTSSNGVEPILIASKNPVLTFDQLLVATFDIFFEPLATQNGICVAAKAKWRNEPPYSNWAFHRSIFERCGVIPKHD